METEFIENPIDQFDQIRAAQRRARSPKEPTAKTVDVKTTK